MLKSKGPVEPAQSLTGAGIAGPPPQWALQQETWPCSQERAALPTGLGRNGPTPRHERSGSAPCLRGVVLAAWTDLLNYHLDPHPAPWAGPP